MKKQEIMVMLFTLFVIFLTATPSCDIRTDEPYYDSRYEPLSPTALNDPPTKKGGVRVYITIDVPEFKESVKLSGTFMKYRNAIKYQRSVHKYSICNPWKDAEDVTYMVRDGRIKLSAHIPTGEIFSLILIVDNKFETNNIIIGGVPMEYPKYSATTYINMTGQYSSGIWKGVSFSVNKEGVVTESNSSSNEPPQNYTGVF